MRYLALALGMLGLFVLYCFFFFEPLSLGDDLLPIHTFVSFSGVVSSERVSSSGLHLMTVGNRSVVCSCPHTHLGKEVRVYGLTDTYNGEFQIRVFRIDVRNEVQTTPS